jgi:hypothetical protein
MWKLTHQRHYTAGLNVYFLSSTVASDDYNDRNEKNSEESKLLLFSYSQLIERLTPVS